MWVYTIVSQKSSQEILKERKYFKVYSISDFQVGDMIEAVFGKKTFIIILKKENLRDLKFDLRKNDGEIKKLKLSKTGEWAQGKVVTNFDIKYLNKFLKNPDLVKKSDDENLKIFFDWVFRKRKKIEKTKKEVETKTGVAEISDLLNFERIIQKPKKYNSEIQELVDEIRNYFQEKAIHGTGSFSYYIGFFKKIPFSQIRQFFGEAKQSKKTLEEKKRLFWWKIGNYLKNKK